jgi:hypothetical protein
MVMLAAALAIDRLALVVDQEVDFAGSGQRLQASIHGGESDRDSAMAEIIMELLCRTKVVDLSKDLSDRGALPGLALRDAHACSLLRRRIGTAMIASTAKQARAMMTMAGPGGAST